MRLIKMTANLTIDGHDYSNFPIPNDRLSQYARLGPISHIVVASVTYIDDERGDVVLVLLLNERKPFFTIGHYYITDFPAEGDLPARFAGDFVEIATHENIVPAVEDYVQNGGDY